jgi:hypothetical protein
MVRSFEIVQEENVIRRIPEGRVGELLSLNLVEWRIRESSTTTIGSLSGVGMF